jgi:integrase/recombinase XerD
MNELDVIQANAPALMPTGQPALANVSGANTDSELVELWLKQRARRSEQTERVYRHEVERFLIAIGKPLRAVTAMDMQGYAEHLEGLKLAPASRARALSTIRSLFSFAHKTGYLTFNVSQVVELPKAPATTEFNFITAPEAQALLEALRPRLRDYAMGALLLKTGLRVSECSKLNLSDVYQDGSGHYGLKVVGKGEKVRRVKLTPDVLNVIASYLRESDRALDGSEAPLFLNKYGARLSTVSMWKVVTAGAKKAGLAKRVTPHTLRHSFATLAVCGGATLAQVQEACGHSDIRTTQRYEHSAKALADTASDYVRLAV